jgi:putative FmdB family regulatory protein
LFERNLEVVGMPIYEYRCHKCRKTFEVMQKFSDQPLSRCPSCSGKVSKIISNCSFQLKGSGWYVTDYKKKDTTWKDKEPDSKKSETPKSETPKSDTTGSKSEEKKS